MKLTIKNIRKWLTFFLLSLSFTFIWIPDSFGQISLFSSPVQPETRQSQPWDLNKSFSCGRFLCSNVYIYDDANTIQRELLVPELTIATLKNLDQSNAEVAQIVEQRAKLIQKIFAQILKEVINPPLHPDRIPLINDWQFWLPSSVKKAFNLGNDKPTHPWIPQIEIGIKNQQTVIYIPEQLELGLPSQSIVTVTQVDAQANGTNIETLAENWKNTIYLSFNNALWGYEFNRQHPLGRWLIAWTIFGMALFAIWLVHFIRSFLRYRSNKLRLRLDELTESLTANPENNTKSNEKLVIDDAVVNNVEVNQLDNSSEKPLNVNENEWVQKKSIKINLKEKLQSKENLFRQVLKSQNQILKEKIIAESKLFLKKQNFLRQRRNVVQLFLRIFFIIEIFILSSALTLICLIFRQTRFFSVYLLKETLSIILVCLGLVFLDKLGDFVIDYLLNRWATEAQIIDSNSTRYTLRVQTYSSNLKKASTFFTIILGIYIGILLLGINTAILTGAGFVAVGLAFLARSLLEDLLNGALILSTDRYVIGDVIDIGNGLSGTVEDMNLFITSLRNLDGQLIAIPNSKITTVINNTKYWSRVNFTIKIGCYENVEKAIDIMVEVANKMQQETEWQDSFLEPIEVLGVDEITYEGIVIHSIIKTTPSSHWPLGREFRLRVKKAFESKNISLGIPHHKVSLIDDKTAKIKSFVEYEGSE